MTRINFSHSNHIYAHAPLCMPFRQHTTELQKFRFDSKDCKSFEGNCEGNDKLFIRIRKKDIGDILDKTAFGTSQIYVRAQKDRPLQIQPGYSINIRTKTTVVCLRSLVYTCSHHSTNDLDFLEQPCFLEFLRRSLRNFSLHGKLSWKVFCWVYSRKSLCTSIKFSLVASFELKVAVTPRQRTQYDVTFATGEAPHVSCCSCCTVCMSAVPNTSTLE